MCKYCKTCELDEYARDGVCEGCLAELEAGMQPLPHEDWYTMSREIREVYE